MATPKSPAKKKAQAKKAAPKKAPAKSAATPKTTTAPKPIASPPLTPGQVAPPFSLVADDGSTVTLAGLKGRTVVVYFYPKDDTPGCTKEACAFRDSSAAYADKGIVVLGVSRDSVVAHTKFKAKYRLSFTLLSDPTADMIAAYGSWGPKKFMGRSFEGILRTTVVIDADGKVRKVYPKVSPETHAQEILRDIEAS